VKRACAGSHIQKRRDAGLWAVDVLERGAPRDSLVANEVVRAVLLIDHFVGTGQSAETGLRELNDAIGDIVRACDIKVVFATVVAFHAGMAARASRRRRAAIGARGALVRAARRRESLLSAQVQSVSRSEQRGRARELAKAQGVLLEKNWPLGYCGLELGVVFERGCPNNTLPILWAESSNPKWMRCLIGHRRREPVHSPIERLRNASAPPNWRSAAARSASYVVRCACEEAEGTSDRGNTGARDRSTRCSIDLSHRVNRITRSVERLTRRLRSTRWSCDPHQPMARVDRTRDRST